MLVGFKKDNEMDAILYMKYIMKAIKIQAFEWELQSLLLEYIFD